jgi:hypothetical protein
MPARENKEVSCLMTFPEIWYHLALFVMSKIIEVTLQKSPIDLQAIMSVFRVAQIAFVAFFL